MARIEKEFAVLERVWMWLNDPGLMAIRHYSMWTHSPLWLSVIGDGLTALAYFSMPLALWYFGYRHPRLRYRWLVVAICAFLLVCGATHVLRIWNIWHQAYWPEALASVLTAVLAAICAVALWPIVPRLLTLPSEDDLQEAYRSVSQRHQQLMLSETRYRLLAETVGEGIWVIDGSGVITYANQAMRDMLHHDGDLLGRRLTDFVFPAEVAVAERNLLRRLSGIRERHEFRFRRSDGSELHAIVHASPVCDNDGKPVGSLKVVTDVSDLIQAEKQLAHLNRELETRVEERTRALEASNRELAQEVIRREYMQQKLRTSNEDLNRYLQELERQNADITHLNRLSDQLHCCDTHAELLAVLERNCGDLFRAEGGALFEWLGDELQALGKPWGRGIDAAWKVTSQALLAVQRGRLFPDSAEQQSTLPAARKGDHHVLMVPLQSRGRGIGVLLLRRADPFWSAETVIDDRFDQLLHAFADHTALALGNLMLREQLREQSLSDPLTGLYNRRYMYQQLARLIALWERGGQGFAVILIDVDHFKSFNDRFGHDVGDEVLVGIADVLQREVRKSDIACRLGGEEFVILMAGAGAGLANVRAETLRAEVKALCIAGAPDETVTISAGVALYPDHGEDAFELMRAADMALYESKRQGRDRISLAAAGC